MYRSLQPRIWPTKIAANRRGLSMIELIITAIVLATTMTLLVPGLYASAKQREQRKFEVLARLELSNLQATARSSAGESSQPALAEWFRSRYPDAELQVEPVPAGAGNWPCGDGLRLSISRAESGDGKSAVVSLVIWPGVDR
jgi:type II secretory pathway pseudopilin PulG